MTAPPSSRSVVRQRSRAFDLLPSVRAFLVVLLAASACSGDAATSGSSDWPLLYPVDPELPSAELVEDLRLDANAQDFSVVRFLYVSPDGRIAVPLRQDYEVRMYEPDGTLAWTFGRQGQGPGEFQAVGSLGWVGDTLWVNDPRLSRVTLVSPGGQLGRMVTPPTRLASPDGGSTPVQMLAFSPIGLLPGGSLWASTRYILPDFSGASPTLIVRAPPGGDAVVVSEPPAREDPRWYLEVEGLGWEMPFAQPPHVAVASDGSRYATLVTEVTSDTDGEVVIETIGAAGDTLLARTYPFTGDPVPESARDSALAALIPEGPVREGPADIGPRRQAIARERMPRVYPPVTGFTLGLDGTLWLDLRETPEGRPTLVLDEDGDPIATVLLPAGSVIQQASREHVWVIETDPFGLSSVVRYRVEGMR